MKEDALRRRVVIPFLQGDARVASVHDVHGPTEQGIDIIFSVHDAVGERWYGVQLKRGAIRGGAGSVNTIETLINQAGLAASSAHAIGRSTGQRVTIDQIIIGSNGSISSSARNEISNRLGGHVRPVFWDLDEIERRYKSYANSTFFSWEEVQRLVTTVYREAESQFRPDYILTMSGPGSAAACQRLSMDFREVPLLVAVTFPRRAETTGASCMEAYRMLANQAGEIHLTADRWEVFLPGVVTHLPAGSKVMIFDDRVLSGDTQLRAQRLLRSRGLDVALAALVAPTALRGTMDFVGRYFDGREYSFPWGLSRGRLAEQTGTLQ